MLSQQPVRDDHEDNVVPISMPIGSKHRLIYKHLGDLFEHFTRKNADAEERLDTLDSETRHLEGAIGDLNSKTASLASLAEDLTEELHTTATSQESTISELVEHAGIAESRLVSLDSKSRDLAAAAQEVDSRTVALERRSLEFEVTDDRLADETQALEARISSLEPRHQSLEDTSRELLQDADTAKSKTEKLTIRFKHAAWITGSSIALLAAAVGVTNWFGMLTVDGYHLNVNQQISDFRSDLSDQMQQLENGQSKVTGRMQQLEANQFEVTGIQQQIGTLQQQIDAKVMSSTEMHKEYEVLSKELEDLNSRLLTMSEQFQGDLRVINDRIYSGDESSQGTDVDMSSLNGTTWLKTQNPNHYVVQLVSVYRKQDLNHFLTRYQKYLPLDQLSKFQTVHRGRDMYVLLYGSYGKFSHAIEKLETLPAPLQQNRPYVRTMGGVQGSMF